MANEPMDPYVTTTRGGYPAVVVGVGPDAPTVTNKDGASQSDLPYHFHTGPVRALFAMARVQKQGDAKYGAGNWRGIDIDDHVNHALSHLLAWVAGDISDDHLVHALCRVAYAVEGEIDQKEGAPDDETP